MSELPSSLMGYNGNKFNVCQNSKSSNHSIVSSVENCTQQKNFSMRIKCLGSYEMTPLVSLIARVSYLCVLTFACLFLDIFVRIATDHIHWRMHPATDITYIFYFFISLVRMSQTFPLNGHTGHVTSPVWTSVMMTAVASAVLILV